MTKRHNLHDTTEDSGMTLTCTQSIFDKGATLETIKDGTASQTSAVYTQDGQAIQLGAWCSCDEDQMADGYGVYFRDEITGSHGWACGICRKIAQTG